MYAITNTFRVITISASCSPGACTTATPVCSWWANNVLIRCCLLCTSVCFQAMLHSKNWSVKNKPWSVILTLIKSARRDNTRSVTPTPRWGVAILTLRKCYLYRTIRSVALTLLEGCFNIPATPPTCRNWTVTGWFGTLHAEIIWKVSAE